ncbi:hypothetical protein Cyrtocomes_01222 [Candidatus Cyrtobacter comes]|uniref:Uncharacterized protein n=2 Tax=Candidatus Cyrtobacter comes TaxID=675776 RepID=A0ABU5L9M8_9RICK|nr:hypothetical protein [Candidatus Cyrtobacter comes]
MNRAEENRIKKVKEIANAVTEKVSKIIQKEGSKKEFNDYIILKEYEVDGDKYGLSQLIHPMVSTFNLIKNQDYKQMYDRLYNSYLLKKHGNVSFQDMKSGVIKKLSEEQDMSRLRAIEHRINTTEILSTEMLMKNVILYDARL